MRYWWICIGSIAAVLLASPATAREEPFGQETVEVRPWRNPPRPDAAPRHRHRHSGGHRHAPGHAHKHIHETLHRHPPGAHRHSHKHGERNGHAHHGLETEHLFGFTRGSDIDPVGSRHFIADFSGRFGKQTGSYAAKTLHLEYAFTPWRDFHVGLGASFAAHNISGVEGFEDRRQAAFEGLSMETRYRLLDRAQAPFGLTIIAEPHWARLDEASGERADKFAFEFTLAVDRELIKDRLYGAINLIYEPEWVRLKQTGEIERESAIGISLAGMTSITPSIFVGGEIRYLRSYEGLALSTFAGEALFLGPVLFANLNDKLTLIAAYSAQVAGRAAGGSGLLDLENFERHRGKLKAVINF